MLLPTLLSKALTLASLGFRGTRVMVGECACALWLCESYGRLSLEVMTLELHSDMAETSKGVPVSVKGIAQIKVMANKASYV